MYLACYLPPIGKFTYWCVSRREWGLLIQYIYIFPYIYISIYIYIFIYICVYIYIYVCIYIYRIIHGDPSNPQQPIHSLRETHQPLRSLGWLLGWFFLGNSMELITHCWLSVPKWLAIPFQCVYIYICISIYLSIYLPMYLYIYIYICVCANAQIWPTKLSPTMCLTLRTSLPKGL